MDISDFEKISLLKPELKVLKSLNKNSPQKIEPDKVRSQGIIRFVHANTVKGTGSFLPFDGTYSINDDGKRYLEYLNMKKRKEFLSDLRGWITTLIAVIALLKSFSPEIKSLIKWILKV